MDFKNRRQKSFGSFSYSFLPSFEKERKKKERVLPWSGDRDEKGGRSARRRTCADSVLVSTRPDSPFRYLRMFFHHILLSTKKKKQEKKRIRRRIERRGEKKLSEKNDKRRMIKYTSGQIHSLCFSFSHSFNFSSLSLFRILRDEVSLSLSILSHSLSLSFSRISFLLFPKYTLPLTSYFM